MSKILENIYNWSDERLGLSELIKFAKKKTVPKHKHDFWYLWGGISLFFFIIQVFTGVLLLVYFRPGPDSYQSVREITYEIDFGWIVRSVHSWSANLMIFSIFVHMFSVFFMKAYRKPREFGWWSGMTLLLLAMVFGFSGYLLPMDELAYFATKVGLEIPSFIPGMDDIISKIVRGGPEIGSDTVLRFFSLHVVILPALFIPILGLHLWLVQKHGNSLPPDVERETPPEKRKSVPFFPNFVLKDLGIWLICLNILSLLAFYYPWQLGPQADPLTPAPLGIHPEWYFMSSFQVLKIIGQVLPGYAGEIAGMLLFTAGLVMWILIPFYDSNSKFQKRAKNATYFGLLSLAILLITTIWGYVAVA